MKSGLLPPNRQAKLPRRSFQVPSGRRWDLKAEAKWHGDRARNAEQATWFSDRYPLPSLSLNLFLIRREETRFWR